jgi:hypothetical protein
MSIKFYTDTHISKQVAIQLRARGIDVIRCQDVGLEDADDDVHFEYAVTNERAFITKDEDFIILHIQSQKDSREHYGIFYCPYRDRPAIGLIVSMCSEYYDLIENDAGTVDDVKNQVIYIK